MARRVTRAEQEEAAPQETVPEVEAPRVALDPLVREARYRLRERNHLIQITTHEEGRIGAILASAAGAEKYQVRFWDCATGAYDLEGKEIVIGGPGKPKTLPAAVFDKIRAADERAVWILHDLHDWMRDPTVVRGLKSLARDLQKDMNKAVLRIIIMVGNADETPANLRNSVVKWDLPLPKQDELGELLGDVLEMGRKPEETSQQARWRFLGTDDPEELRRTTDAVLGAALGLTAADASNAFSKSITRTKRVDPGIVAAEKKRIVDREKGVTWYKPDPRGLAALGGLDLLKKWFLEKVASLSPDAKEYGLIPPKAVLLAGPPGTGKSATSKAIATVFGVPLVRLDLAALKGGTVGASETNIRGTLKMLEAIAPCCVWVDEIDAALSGATSEHTGDSGVAKDQMGTLLTWLQEHEGFIFLIATTNNPSRLPPELTRAGRFNATFFCDLPNTTERVEVLKVALAALPVPRDPERFDLLAVARATPGFSGAELAELPSSALDKAFLDGKREPTTADLLRVAGETIPVSRSAADRLKELRDWASTKARPASYPEERPTQAALTRFGGLEIDPNDLDEEEEIQ